MLKYFNSKICPTPELLKDIKYFSFLFLPLLSLTSHNHKLCLMPKKFKGISQQNSWEGTSKLKTP